MDPQGTPSPHNPPPGTAVFEAVAEEGKVREAVGVFRDLKHLEEAVRELESTAFPRDSITVLGAQKDVSTAFGRKPVTMERMEDDPRTPRRVPLRPEEKTIGAALMIGCAVYIGVVAGLLATGSSPLHITIAAVLLGGCAGAAIGGVIVELIVKKMSRNIEREVGHGGLILWVRTPDPVRERLACEIMRNHGARHVRVHDIT